MNSFPWLTATSLVPLVGAVVVALLPRRSSRLAAPIALAVTLVALVMAGAAALTGYDSGGPQFQLTESYDWIPAFGVQYAVGVDGIALLMWLLVAAMMPLAVLTSWREVPSPDLAALAPGAEAPAAEEARSTARRQKAFFALMLVLQWAMLGVFTATDLFLFYVFFEAMLIPAYFLIGMFGGPRRSYAALKFLLYSLFGGLVMLAGVVGLWVIAQDQLGHPTLAHADLVGLDIDPGLQKWLFAAFFVAFAIKAPLVPFHTWLPDAAAESPVGVAAILVAVMDKVGTYGMLRMLLPYFPDASQAFAPVVIVLAVIGIVYGALLAIGQTDMKRLVAYTSISHFGFIALGIFAFTSQAQAGATFYMVNHGFSTGALFFVVGMMIARRGSRKVEDYGGVQAVAPWFAGAFLLVGLSSLAMPGMSTFVSEFMVLVGAFPTEPVAAVISAVGIVLAALYVLWLYQRTMTGPLKPAVARFPEITKREAAVLVPAIAVLLVLGFYPKPVLDVATPAVDATMSTIDRSDPPPTIPVQAGNAEEGTTP